MAELPNDYELTIDDMRAVWQAVKDIDASLAQRGCANCGQASPHPMLMRCQVATLTPGQVAMLDGDTFCIIEDRL